MQKEVVEGNAEVAMETKRCSGFVEYVIYKNRVNSLVPFVTYGHL